MSSGETGSQAESKEKTARAGASIAELEQRFSKDPSSSAFVPLCEAYLEEQRFMEAMVVCKKAVKAASDPLPAKLMLARVYIAQGKLKRAHKEVDALVAAHPKDPGVYVGRAELRAKEGDEAEAVADLKRAIDLDPHHVRAAALLEARGVVYPEPVAAPPPPVAQVAHPAAAGLEVPPPGAPAEPAPPPGMRLEEDEVVQHFQEVQKQQRGKPKTTLFLLAALILITSVVFGYRMYQKHRTEEIDRLTQIAVPAFNQDTYGAYKKAAEALQRIVDNEDDAHPLTLARLAHTYAILVNEHGDSGYKEKLDKVLPEAERLGPDISHTVAARALVKMGAGRDRKSAEAARAIVQPLVDRVASEQGPPTYADLTLGLIEMRLGEYEDAYRRLTHTRDSLLGSVRARVLQAMAAYKARRLGAAQAGFQAALRAEPNHPGALAWLALVMLERGNMDGAQRALNRFDQVAAQFKKDVSDKDRALAEYARSEIFRSAGEDSKAAGAYALARRLDPGNADFPYGRGRWLLRNDRAKEAIKPLSEAVKAEPDRWAFLVELAEAEMFARDFSAADKHIKKARKLAPNFHPAVMARARWLRRTKDKSTEKFLKDDLKAHPNSAVEVNLELGRLYRAEKRYKEAQVALEAAVEAMSAYPKVVQAEVLMSYGRLMRDMGDLSTAANAYKSAARLGDVTAYYRLSVVLASRNPKAAKRACTTYLKAGRSLRFSQQAARLCQSL